MKVAVLKETAPGERRVAVVPAGVPALAKAGLTVAVESGAGTAAGFSDDDYRSAGATIATRDEALAADAHTVTAIAKEVEKLYSEGRD